MRETTHPSAYGCHLPYQGRLEQAFSEREGGPLAVDESSYIFLFYIDFYLKWW